MTITTFRKTLSANDVGATGTHQGGILIPKTEGELLAFLPSLDPSTKNPDAWIECVDENGTIRRMRFVYYNNKFHDKHGTRNEYRITYMTRYFREVGATAGEGLEISRGENQVRYEIRIIRQSEDLATQSAEEVVRIKITSGWQRVH